MEIIVFPIMMLVFAAPGFFTIWNLIHLFCPVKSEGHENACRVIELLTGAVGFVLTAGYLAVNEVMDADYTEQLINAQKHAPVFSGSAPTLTVVMLLTLAGYVILRYLPPEKQPPLLTVFSMAALWVGAVPCVLWSIQTIGMPLLIVLPVNLLLIGARTMMLTVRKKAEAEASGKRKKLRGLAGFLTKAACLPVLSLLAALPLFAVVTIVLVLFGQEPDALIRAWTDTAEWTLSQQTAPPNVYVDEHYLCTVAAGGHRKLVRPLREGKRHGHRVLVNRQLMAANAFEDLLHERVPRFHRLVRGAYDRFGYPIARHIRTKGTADLVYILMKPAEWLFVLALYAFDPSPENRIAVQYPHSPLPKR